MGAAWKETEEGEKMGKKVLLIIPAENYRDEELEIPKKYFGGEGLEITIASTMAGECSGMMGGTATAEKALEDVNVGEYDAVAFIGGSGTPSLRSNERALEIAREANGQGKVLGALCWAPTTLAKAGVLEGKKATVWFGDDPEYGMKTDKVLEKYGATYTGEGCTVDGDTVTADGPDNAENFAREIVKALNQ
ncbi:DJ-1 family protein [Candidatus Micrarchaeota archaeon]|nr:DJ-1 family protein [Candidatus Micrarchaeota archaeon]